MKTLYFVLYFIVIVQASSENCTQPKEEGIGDKQDLTFYYDPTAGKCLPFYYKGSGGNANRFNSDRECMKACSLEKEDLYPTGRAVCEMPMDPGMCLGRTPMFYYDSKENICKSFFYGGCQGNGNRFQSKKECKETCQALISGRSGVSGTEELEEPEPTSVNLGLSVGIVGGVIFAVALISLIVVTVLQRKKKRTRKPVPTEVEMA